MAFKGAGVFELALCKLQATVGRGRGTVETNRVATRDVGRARDDPLPGWLVTRNVRRRGYNPPRPVFTNNANLLPPLLNCDGAELARRLFAG